MSLQVKRDQRQAKQSKNDILAIFPLQKPGAAMGCSSMAPQPPYLLLSYRKGNYLLRIVAER